MPYIDYVYYNGYGMLIEICGSTATCACKRDLTPFMEREVLHKVLNMLGFRSIQELDRIISRHGTSVKLFVVPTYKAIYGQDGCGPGQSMEPLDPRTVAALRYVEQRGVR